MINPEDTEHHHAVAGFLRERGLPAERTRHFRGYATASRSYVLVDPNGRRRIEFSAKVSTNQTGGQWRDKRQPGGEVTYLLHGNVPPKWLSEARYPQWSREFFRAYEHELADPIGVPLSDLTATMPLQSERYFRRHYRMNSPGMERWLRSLERARR